MPFDLRSKVARHLDTVDNPLPFSLGENIDLAMEAIDTINEDGEWDAEIDLPYEYNGKEYLTSRTIVNRLELHQFLDEPDSDDDPDAGLEDFD